ADGAAEVGIAVVEAEPQVRHRLRRRLHFEPRMDTPAIQRQVHRLLEEAGVDPDPVAGLRGACAEVDIERRRTRLAEAVADLAALERHPPDIGERAVGILAVDVQSHDADFGADEKARRRIVARGEEAAAAKTVAIEDREILVPVPTLAAADIAADHQGPSGRNVADGLHRLHWLRRARPADARLA